MVKRQRWRERGQEDSHASLEHLSLCLRGKNSSLHYMKQLRRARKQRQKRSKAYWNKGGRDAYHIGKITDGVLILWITIQKNNILNGNYDTVGWNTAICYSSTETSPQAKFRALPATFDSMSPVICCSVPPRVTDAMCQIPCFFPTVLSLLHLISKKGAETAGREKPEWHIPAATLGRTNNDSLVRGTLYPWHIGLQVEVGSRVF